MKERNMMNTTGIGKHVIAVLAIFAVIFFFSGCSSTPTPTETTDTFLQALKSQDKETMATVYSGEELDLLDAATESADPEASEEAEDLEDMAEDTGLARIYEEEMLPKMLDFDYELSNEQINGDKATVDVKITTYRMGDALTAFMGDYISQAFMLAFSDASEEELDALATTILSGKLAGLTEKNYEQTATISLTKVDGKWMVDTIQTDGDVIDAITGGLVTAVSNLDEAFSAWEEESDQ